MKERGAHHVRTDPGHRQKLLYPVSGQIGLVRLEGDRVCLIDSGSDKDAGRKVRQILDANGWRLTAIYNTHSNADHIGGNQYLQKQTGCRIFAPGVERDFTQHTVLEPSFLYGAIPSGSFGTSF